MYRLNGHDEHARQQYVQRIPMYQGISSNLIKPVFQAALRLRSKNPNVATVKDISKSKLDTEIIAAIIEGALRILPPDNSPAGLAARQDKEAAKARFALEAETAFVAAFRNAAFNFDDEMEQKAKIKERIDAGEQDVKRSTPDILFHDAVLICGRLCCWIEFKNTFGFKKNPYLHPSHKKQCQRYASEFGPGIIVYRLGFQRDLFAIEGVYCFREVEILEWLREIPQPTAYLGPQSTPPL